MSVQGVSATSRTAESSSQIAGVLAKARDLNKINGDSVFTARRYFGADDKAAKARFRRECMLLHTDRLPKEMTPAEVAECSSAFSKLNDLHRALTSKPAQSFEGASTAVSTEFATEFATEAAARLEALRSAIVETAGTVQARVKEFVENPTVQTAAVQARNIGVGAAVAAGAFWATLKAHAKKD